MHFILQIARQAAVGTRFPSNRLPVIAGCTFPCSVKRCRRLRTEMRSWQSASKSSPQTTFALAIPVHKQRQIEIDDVDQCVFGIKIPNSVFKFNSVQNYCNFQNLKIQLYIGTQSKRNLRRRWLLCGTIGFEGSHIWCLLVNV